MTRATCYHQKKLVVWTSVGADVEPLAGPRQLRHQCEDCGRLLPNALPHSLATLHTPSVDLNALRRWIAYDRQQWDQKRVERGQIDRQRKLEWRVRYEDYLQSEEWQVRRQKVLRRSGGLCEGCGDSPATQVHHLTYEHLGNEFLWELKAVCRPCHERVHASKGDPISFQVDSIADFVTQARRRREGV